MKYYFLDANLQNATKNRAEAAAINVIRLFNHFVVSESDAETLLQRWSVAMLHITRMYPRCGPIQSYIRHYHGSPSFHFCDKYSVHFIKVVVDPPSEFNRHPLSHPELAVTQLPLF